MEARYQVPSYQTLKNRTDISFPPTLAGGQLLTKQIQIDNNSNIIIPHTLHYFEPVQLMEGLLCMWFRYYATFCMSPTSETYNLWITHIWRSYFCDLVWKCIQQFSCIRKWSVEVKTGCLFVALAVFSDGSPIDKLLKHSKHPPVFVDNF